MTLFNEDKYRHLIWDAIEIRGMALFIDNVARCSFNGIIDNGSDLMKKIARKDGFKNYDLFFNWFNKDFTCKIIYWTDFRY